MRWWWYVERDHPRMTGTTMTASVTLPHRHRHRPRSGDSPPRRRRCWSARAHDLDAITSRLGVPTSACGDT